MSDYEFKELLEQERESKEKLEIFQRVLKARIEMNNSIIKDDRSNEITLSQLDAENRLCNLLLAFVEVDEDE